MFGFSVHQRWPRWLLRLTAAVTAITVRHAAAAPAGHRVTSLPGVDLSASNASHFSGYLEVQQLYNVFYYYVQHPDPTKPLLVWMNGGPGASSLMGLFTELGPLLLNSRSLPANNADGDWQLLSNPYAWSTEASLLVWEQPAGVGFSRCIAEPCAVWNDTSAAGANLEFLLAFYEAFPSERGRELVISGESYAGIYVPMLAQLVHEHNAGLSPSSSSSSSLASSSSSSSSSSSALIPLKGIAVGNGCVGYGVKGGCGLDALDLLITVLEQGAPGVSRSVLAATRADCQGELDTGKTPQELSEPCRRGMRAVFEDVAAWNQYSYGSACGPDGSGNWGDGSGFSCGADAALKEYLSGVAVQEALHALPPGSSTPLKWQAWDGDSPLYVIVAENVVPVYAALLEEGYGVTIYNGLRDTAVPAQGAEKWIQTVGNSTVVSPRRKWSAPSVGGSQKVGAQVAGYVTRYASGIQFATAAGAGHLMPGERPESALALIGAVLRDEPLPEYTGAKCKRLWLGKGYGKFC